MTVVLPQPVGPTMATRWPGFTVQVEILDQRLVRPVGEGHVLKLHLPVGVLQHPGIRLRRAPGAGSSSISSNTRPAQARAFCSSVTTPEISLKGLVYWLA